MMEDGGKPRCSDGQKSSRLSAAPVCQRSENRKSNMFTRRASAAKGGATARANAPHRRKTLVLRRKKADKRRLVNTLQARECRQWRRDGASERAPSPENLGFAAEEGGQAPPCKHLTGVRVPPRAARRREYALRKGVLLVASGFLPACAGHLFVASGLLPACAGHLLTPIRAPSSQNLGFAAVNAGFHRLLYV